MEEEAAPAAASGADGGTAAPPTPLALLQASLLDLPLPSDQLLHVREGVSGPAVATPACWPQGASWNGVFLCVTDRAFPRSASSGLSQPLCYIQGNAALLAHAIAHALTSQRLEPDTLMWIYFYQVPVRASTTVSCLRVLFQQGTPQQLYAAAELRKSFWRSVLLYVRVCVLS